MEVRGHVYKCVGLVHSFILYVGTGVQTQVVRLACMAVLLPTEPSHWPLPPLFEIGAGVPYYVPLTSPELENLLPYPSKY